VSRKRREKHLVIADWKVTFLGSGVLPTHEEECASDDEWTISEWRYHRSERDDPVRHAWEQVGDVILAQWIKHRPGSRPYGWWAFQAPEHRRRLGGIGTPEGEKLAFRQYYRFGIPDRWVLKQYVEAYPHLDLHVPDPAAPPLFESQAAYLDRLDLFVDGERECLPPDAFDPVRYVPTPD
jgi:hypothetical protein